MSEGNKCIKSIDSRFDGHRLGFFVEIYRDFFIGQIQNCASLVFVHGSKLSPRVSRADLNG